jgi:regulator of protease activity HflC (stomatin/prohibitin superfamily)
MLKVALKNIYYSFEEDYEAAFIYIIEGISRDISALYYAFDFYEKRSELQTDMLLALRSVFQTNLSVSIEDLQLVDITLPEGLSEEIQNTELAKQDSLRALNERDVAQL